MVGQTLGHYQIIEKIGAGGMGVVYRAHDIRLDRDVALKVLPPGTLADEDARRRFRQEALALSKLNHPNIATIHDFDSQNGVDFLVMEYIAGTSLAEKIRTGAQPEKEVAALGVQIAAALEEAHEQRIVHRDLKPGNILVTPKGQVKILDFGLATLFHAGDGYDATRSLTRIEGLAGTLAYMAPERLRGHPADGRSDIYAAGTVLYEMVTGSRPFQQELSTALSDDILHKAPPPPGRMQPNLSSQMEEIILKCLEKEPDSRYQSAKELGVDLKRLGTSTVRTGLVAARPRRGLPRWVIVVALAAGILAAVYAGFRLAARRGPAIDSLAILPFENASVSADTEYLSDGLTESLINSVSQLPNLKVIARSSVFRYKGRQMEPRTVARELGVRAVLTGRVVQRGDSLSISTELVDARDDRHLWGDQYNRPLTDVLALQEQISKDITANLRLQLTGKEEKRLTKHYTEDTQAYQLYLKGRYYSDQWTAQGTNKGIEYFHQAIEKDPNYALAYAGIAEAYFIVSSQFLAPRDAMPEVKKAATHALEIDDSVAEAHTLLGLVKAIYEYDYAGAEREFKRAIELNSGSASAHQYYGYFLTARGRQQEALSEFKKAEDLDPLSGSVSALLGVSLLFARQYDQAIEQSRKTIELDPNFWWGHFWLGWAYEQKGMHDEAVKALIDATRLEASPYATAYLGFTYARAGKKEKALAMLQALQEKSKHAYVPAYHVAVVYAGLRDREMAEEWLEKAYNGREEILAFLKVDPTWDILRTDPRFERLLRRVGLK